MLTYNIFGSKDSVDCDVMLFVDQLPPTIEQAKKLCAFYDEEIQKELNTDKEINTNLAIVRDGVITACFKGIPIETNNSLFRTYQLHEQVCAIGINRQLPVTEEWVLEKTARAMRIILSFLSRTEHRTEVKAALKGSPRQKMATLLGIDLALIEDFGKNNQCKEDVYKNIAFQLGQARALLELPQPCELYTKEAIADYYWKLKPYLNREENADPRDLNTMKDRFISEVIEHLALTPYGCYDIDDIKE